MNAGVALLLVGTFASGLVMLVAAFRFSFSYRRWQQATRREFSSRDPARNFEHLFSFLGAAGARDPQPGPELRRASLRLGKIALIAAGVFAAFVLAVMLVSEVS